MENIKIDFDHYRGSQIADEIQQNLSEERQLKIINLLNPTFSKDGNQFCYLYGKDLQSGIAGFGDTPYKAMDSFCQAFYSETIAKATTI